MFGIGTWELFIIVFLSMLVLGPERMTRHAFTLGKWMRRFQQEAAKMTAVLRAEFAKVDEENAVGSLLQDVQSIRSDFTSVFNTPFENKIAPRLPAATPTPSTPTEPESTRYQAWSLPPDDSDPV
ncbi:MAG TPA: twin-arginine translocase TatA/TatE family subunit [Anaerolineales bacterium]|nr:twin-arginine translocase TatA/TatE family subunit [Anaerolineales bacterium]